MRKIKVVSAQSMTKLEGLAYAGGCKEFDFMEGAGSSIAEKTEVFIQESKSSSQVTLLVGKGNNGGDAYVAGRKLLEKGIRVTAFHVYHIDQCGPLCRHQKERFEKVGGQIRFLDESKDICLPSEGVILDGLVGTGFKGKAEGVLADVIVKANNSSLPILAIDIPSGLCGNTGSVDGVAIQATATIYLELPKLGFFLKDGWNHVGKLIKAEFGLPKEYLDQAEAACFVVEEVDASLLPKIRRCRNKYDAGYVLVLAGSYAMTGAGILASYAALKSGAGIVRWFYPPEIAHLTSAAPFELVKEPFLEDSRFEEEMKKAKALIIGPGMGREKPEQKKIKGALSSTKVPTVIDADALFFLAKNPSFKIPQGALLTPHMGELSRIVDLQKQDLLTACQAFVDEKKTCLLLKGAPNFLFSQGETPLILPFGNPGMATAGSGDVLSGILAAFLAQGLKPTSAALLASYLHGKSGDLAAHEKTWFCITASDLLDYLPRAFSFS
jgi:NAD(P)H-hydrate epimerase